MLSRLALIENMETVADALASNDQIPVLQYFWFTGRRLMAFDKEVAISIPCETDFTGAVPRTLLDLLKTSKAKDIELQEKDNGLLLVKAGSSTFKLPTLPPDDFIFEMPGMRKDTAPLEGADLIDALRNCARSLGGDKSRADFQGVTFIQMKGELMMFGFDRVTVSYSLIKIDGKIDTKRAIVPTAFCKQLLKIADGMKGEDPEIDLEINDRFALARIGDITVYGALIEPDDPTPFVRYLDETLDAAPDFFEVPREKLEGILERASIIVSRGIAKTRTRVEVREGKNAKASFSSKSDAGEAEDFCIIEGHPEITALIDPRRVLDGIEFPQMRIVEVKDSTVFVMCNEDQDRFYLVSSD